MIEKSMGWGRWLPVLTLLLVASLYASAEDKPKAAFFPLGGDADQNARDKVGFALRTKLDRDGHYEVIDGPRMKDIAAESKVPVDASTPVEEIKELGKVIDATLLIWGEMDTHNAIKLKVLDLREKDGKPRDVSKKINQPTDLRFVTEAILESLPGVEKFDHPSETAVTDDATARELFKKNPNLVKNWDFAKDGSWTALYMSEKYELTIKTMLPDTDKVNLYKLPDGSGNALAMSLSKQCAENNGMAAKSDPIKIVPNKRYRLSFKYKSDGPSLHVFVKGYTTGEDIKGEKAEREVYRRQVPPSGATDGKWVEVVDDLNPQHIAFPVETLRVDLYAYLSPGSVMFKDIVLKEVGAQTRIAKDDAIKMPVTRPVGKK